MPPTKHTHEIEEKGEMLEGLVLALGPSHIPQSSLISNTVDNIFKSAQSTGVDEEYD